MTVPVPRRRSRAAGASALLAALAIAGCTGDPADRGPDGTAAPTTTDAPTDDGTERSTGPEGPVAAPVRHPATASPIYFVMPDRFANGDPSNDTGGIDGGPLDHGFLPADVGFHHGGDIAGLRANLDYVAGLGVGAIWVTPPFTNDPVQGNGTVAGSSSGYHGYWQVDFSAIDPHLGTDEEFAAFVEEAQALGLRVYLDAVVNHTGDVIALRSADGDVGGQPYVPTSAVPYRDADGGEIDLARLGASGAPWPALDPVTSFPYVPVLAPGDAERKSPDWLNDVTLYHNRGNSTFSGESSLLGDFFGLDDLMTEHPTVREGMTDVYADVVRRFGVDGFRVDTVKHVDLGFWEVWSPGVRDRSGRSDLFTFGEVFDTSTVLQSRFTGAGLDATLDFRVEDALARYVLRGGGAESLAEAFDDDDWFTDADGSAAQQVLFLGNHDAGRLGTVLRQANVGLDEDEQVALAALAQDLLFTVRGIPVVYYGDEQGFVGDGGDRLARAPMFPASAEEYLDDDSLGTDATPADDNFDTEHPLYRHIAAVAARRASTTALRTGAMRVLHAEGPLFAFSRVDRDERVEHVVLANVGTAIDVPVTLDTLTPDATFTSVPVGDDSLTAPGSVTATSDADGALRVEVPPLTTIVLRADREVPLRDPAPAISLVRPDGGDIVTERYRLEAEVGGTDGVPDDRYAEVTFALSVDGGEPVVLGTDDAPPYRVYWDPTTVPDGTVVEVVATVDDRSGRYATARAEGTVALPER